MHLMGGDYLTGILLNDGQQPFFPLMAVGKGATPPPIKSGHRSCGLRVARDDAKGD